MLVHQLLEAVPDCGTILDMASGADSPLAHLVEDYRTFVKETDTPVKDVDETTTGSQFKTLLEAVPPVFQVKMLNKFTESVQSIRNPYIFEHPKDIEERRLKHWVIKVMVVVVALMICLITGMTMASAVWQGVVPDDSLITSLMSAATEILKLIISY